MGSSSYRSPRVGKTRSDFAATARKQRGMLAAPIFALLAFVLLLAAPGRVAASGLNAPNFQEQISDTATATNTPLPITPIVIVTDTPTEVATGTATNVATNTSTATNTPVATSTLTATATQTGPTATPTSTPRPFTPLPSPPAPQPSTSATATNTPVLPTATNTAEATSTNTAEPTSTAVETETPVPPIPARTPKQPRTPGDEGDPTGAAADPSGAIGGKITLSGVPAIGVRVELHAKSADGNDSMVATTSTDGIGAYHFLGIGSSPAGGAYYVLYPGGQDGTLASWYSFGAIYQSGETMSLPPFEIADVRFTALESIGALPAVLNWARRGANDIYQVHIYAGESQIYSSDELSDGSSFTVPMDALQSGTYWADLSVRVPNSGYGRTSASGRIGFTIVAPTATSTPPAPVTFVPVPTDTPVPTAATVNLGVPARSELRISMGADRNLAAPGDNVQYIIEVTNVGAGAATGVVLRQTVPDALQVDLAHSSSERGAVTANGSNVLVVIGTIGAGKRVLVRIVATVATGGTGTVFSTAAIFADDLADGLSSNSIALELPSGAGTQAIDLPAAPEATATALPAATATIAEQEPSATPTQSAPAAAATPTRVVSGDIQNVLLPQTGNELPLLALLLGAIVLVVRQVRVRRGATRKG